VVGILVVLWLILAPFDHARATEGLIAQVYNIQGQNNAPYIPQGASPVRTVSVPNIDFQWGSGSVLGGPSEDVIVRFTGSIRSNTTQNISFLATADDGTKLYIDGINITNDWYDKGGGGTTSDPISFTAGVPKTIELLYYENGGGANVFLHWDQSGSMDIIPSSAFTSQAAPVIKTIGAPRNLVVTDSGTAAVLNWEAPNTGNTQPERYAISFSADGGGWGIATGNVGDANALNTTISVPYSTLESLKPSGTTWTFSVRSDNDTNSLYSQTSNQVTIKIGKTQAEKDAEAAAILAAQQEVDRQTAANTAVSNYETQTVTTLAEVSIAENLKLLADSATAIVLNQNVKLSLQSRIDAKSSVVSSAKTSLTQAKLEAEAAALLAAQQEAARIAAEQEAARQAAIAEAARVEAARLEAARLEAERLAALAEEERLAELERQRLEAEEAARIEAERQAAIKAEEDRLAAEKAEEDRIAAEKAEADRLAAEQAEADRIAEEKVEAERLEAEREAEEKAQAEAEALAEEERIAEEEEAKELEEALAEEAAEEKELKEIIEDAKDGKELTEEQTEIVVAALIEDLKPGESLSAAEIKASGISYADLPAETPVEIRTDENGNALVITAEVAANVELVQDPGALLEAAFTDPGAALAALGSIGADMTEAEREEATDMVVATVVAAGAAINAAAVATGGSTGGSTGGGGSSGGGSGSNSPGSRGGRKW
jgi:hypothetical protein